MYDDHEQAVLYSDGSVSLLPRAELWVRCPVTDNFINCTMKFGSWTYDGSRLDVQGAGGEIDLSTYYPYQGYNIVNTKVTRNVHTYDCCPEPYVDLTFKLVLRSTIEE